MEKNEKLQMYRIYAEAARQAQAIMGIDEDCRIDDKEFRQIKRHQLNNPNILTLSKKYYERRLNCDRG